MKNDKFSKELEININNLLIFIEYLSIYAYGPAVQRLFFDLVNGLLRYPCKEKYSDITLDKIFTFYNFNNLFCQICILAMRSTDLSVSKEIAQDFLLLLRHRVYETLYSLVLYPFCKNYIRTNFKYYPEECSSLELYFGISSGYFTIKYHNNTYNALIELCNNASDAIIHKASFDNPIYVFSQISSSFTGVSILNHKSFINRLFSH